MSLSPGSRIGSYEIVAPLGAGGMGEVYEARDSKLNRNVAIKILPPALSADPDRLARFRREAQVLASLNHPNIAAVYGLEDEGDTLALVMELVPGRTLDELIAAGHPEAESVSSRLRDGASAAGRGGGAPRGLNMDDALPIGRQIASALEAAHEQGIIHRDLKPANVKITHDGTVKVLDFGLAKALGAPGSAAADQANSPTLTSPAMTELGMILGTAGYMAPEQAKGKAVDRRADIWALGVVLFEMLSGRSLYRGETVTETIAHVITQPPSWDLLPETVPTPVRRLLRRCLEKDPRNRLQSAGDARIEIDEILSGSPFEADLPATTGAAHAAATPAWRRALPWAIAGVLLVLLGDQLWPRPAAPAQAARLDVRLTPGEDLSVVAGTDGTIAVLSPDGGTLVYLAVSGSARQLYVRRLDELEATPLAGTESATQQFFSPDGASVAFFANGQLMRTSLAGGTPAPIATALNGRGGSWGPDDTIVFAADVQEGLSRVSAAGGPSAPVTTLAPNERTHRWPSMLPDGRHVLFMCQTTAGAYDDGTIEAARIDTGERKVLIRGGTFPRYVGGYLVYTRGSTLYAVPFDVDALEVRGDPQPVLVGLLASGGALGSGVGGTGAAQISIAENGTVAYLAGEMTYETTRIRLAIVDRSGQILYEYPEPRLFRDPRLSPDGKQIAVRIDAPTGPQLHLVDTERGTLNQITFDAGNESPIWSHDGRFLAFASGPTDQTRTVYLMPNDGTGEPKPLIEGGAFAYPTSFSPDDRLLAVTRQDDADPRRGRIEIVSVADGVVTPFPDPPTRGVRGQFSPDGKWMTFGMADSSGIGDVYVRAYPGGGALRRVSTAGGIEPQWTRNGREIVFLDFTGAVMAVDVSPAGDALVIGNPHKLFERSVVPVSTATTFDAAADGSRFVMLVEDTQETSAPQRTHVTMVFNFLEELRRATAGTAR